MPTEDPEETTWIIGVPPDNSFVVPGGTTELPCSSCKKALGISNATITDAQERGSGPISYLCITCASDQMHHFMGHVSSRHVMGPQTIEAVRQATGTGSTYSQNEARVAVLLALLKAKHEKRKSRFN